MYTFFIHSYFHTKCSLCFRRDDNEYDSVYVPNDEDASTDSSDITTESHETIESNEHEDQIHSKAKRGRPLERTLTLTENKVRKARGQSYESRAGQKKRNKMLQTGCGPTCRMKCHQKLSEEERSVILKNYWALGDVTKQRTFIISHVTDREKKKNAGVKTRRCKTLSYSFQYEDSRHLVCKTFFLHTLNITDQVVRTALAKRTSTGTVDGDNRGNNWQPRYAESLVKRAAAKSQIKRLPVLPSHYARAESNRLYLPADYSIKKCYDLYAEECDEPISFSTYRSIFNSLNLSIHNPKKDACSTCECFKNKPNKSEEDKLKQEEHLNRKERARMLKTEAKLLARMDPTTAAAFVFDFEAQLLCPKGKASLFYYSHKLICYNFTIFNLANNDGICNFWHEGIGGKGAHEVASCLYNYLEELDNKGLQSVITFSDACGSQNRNYIVCSMLLNFIMKATHVNDVNMIFMESGHSQNEGDSMHALIEKASRQIDVYVPDQWVGVLKAARPGKQYAIKEIGSGDLKDWSYIQKNFFRTKNLYDTGEQFLISKAKWLRISKEVDTCVSLQASESYEVEDMKTVGIRRQTRGRIADEPIQKPFQTGVSLAKKKDLCKLCDNWVIPEVHHAFYRNMKTNVSVTDTIEGNTY